MNEWQNRTLDSVSLVVFIDCIHVKLRDGKVYNRPTYVALAVLPKALKPACTAPTQDVAEETFPGVLRDLGKKYPAIVKLWENAWAEFVPFLQFDSDIR